MTSVTHDPRTLLKEDLTSYPISSETSRSCRVSVRLVKCGGQALSIVRRIYHFTITQVVQNEQQRRVSGAG